MSAPIIFTIPESFISSSVQQDICITEMPSNPSRKRRLDHLTWEEKIQRKKLKNRVAAQTSRDRKKAKMDEMEDRMKCLEMTNRKITEEMRKLKEFNERLIEENKELRVKCQCKCEGGVCGSSSRVGPAVSLLEPLQQVKTDSKAPPSHHALALTLAMLCLLSKISSRKLTQKNTSIVSNNLQTAFSEKLIQKLENHLHSNPKMYQKAVNLHKWWGPHQGTWNPMDMKI